MLDNLYYGKSVLNQQNEQGEKEIDVDQVGQQFMTLTPQTLADEERNLYREELVNLGLCEKIGINGHIMLYPEKIKEKKWHSSEYKGMVNRLYKVKLVDPYPSMKDEFKSQIMKDKLGKIKSIKTGWREQRKSKSRSKSPKKLSKYSQYFD